MSKALEDYFRTSVLEISAPKAKQDDSHQAWLEARSDDFTRTLNKQALSPGWRRRRNASSKNPSQKFEHVAFKHLVKVGALCPAKKFLKNKS